ncbi:hypothetical protein FRC10_011307 [Ceratobasidium sp. 414]|nr:hypothetical protein FRC10_011307 [Ceratobasidium sp. 414]
MPGSLIIEDIVQSDMETDVDELADRFSTITDLDDPIEQSAGVEDYFTSQEVPIDDEAYLPPGSSSNYFEGIIRPTRDVELPPDVHLVAFSPTHQEYFEDYGIAWGVQWEIARLTTAYRNFSWKDVTEEDILGFCGTNAGNATSVPGILLAKSPEFMDYARRERLIALPALVSPWEDYDDEESYIRADRDAELMNEHGGKVTQRIHLQITKSSMAEAAIDGLYFKFTLEQPTKSKSSRFSRYMGSRRLIQCHFSERDGRSHREAIIRFFASKKLLVNGRLFQAFYGHGSKVELMEINEDIGRASDTVFGDHNRISLLEFVAWHNNVDLNYRQTLGKWVSRFALGFSTSLAGLTFTHDNIHFVEDIYAPGTDRESAGAHEIMTDGCGFLNWAALKAIQEKMGWDVFPVHVQARIAGAKGLFALHPENRDPNEQPQIWIRSSQNKVKLQRKDTWSRFHYVLDVCSGPFFQQPSSITYEMILCLSARGVPDHILIELIRKSIENIANDHEPPQHAHGSHVLWDSIYNTHRVLQNRLRQVISPEQQRAQGFFSYGEDGEISPEEAISAKWDGVPDPNSGTPATAQEQILGWLQAGFSPTDPWVIEKLVYLQEKLMKAAVKKFRITIPKSLRAHIIPDPIGVLDEGEVFFASGQTLLEDSSGLKKHCLTGPVIVIAVEDYRLWSLGYHDVVVFSTKGDCSLASLLSGGDYDGDNVVMIWDEAITSSFINSDLSSARPSDGFEKDNFDKSKEMLGDVVSRLKLQKRELQTELVKALLQGAVASRLEGRYNIFYRNSAYLNGLDHPDTVRLGHMFTQCLDSTKSGLVVKKDVLQRDVMKWDKKPPECFVQEMEDESLGRKVPLRRDKDLPPFILDTLLHVADEETKLYKDRLSRQRDELARSKRDNEHLTRPYEEAKERASRHGCEDDLKQIRDHVEKYRDLFTKARCNQGEFSPLERHGKGKKTEISIGDRQESARAVSEAYNFNLPSGLAFFDEAAIRRVAASYAFYLDKSISSSKFNFSFGVAWAELCSIKARATGGDFVTLAPGYMDTMAMHKKLVRVFREQELESP